MDEASRHYMNGLGFFGQRKYTEAIAEHRKALDLRPEWSDCLQALGMAQLHGDLIDEALATLQRVTELAPEDPLAFTSLSMAYQRKNLIPEAEKAQAQARMLAWKLELKTNPKAPPPDLGAMKVTQ